MFAIIMIFMMLLSFVIIIASSLSYLVYVDWSNKRFEAHVTRIYKAFANTIDKTVQDYMKDGHPVEEEVVAILRKIRKRTYEKVFQNVMVDYANDEATKDVIPQYIQLYEDYILKKLKKVPTNGNVNHIQNVFILGEYRFNHPSITAYLMEGVDSTSIISRFNSVSALSKIGNADALVIALIKISRQRQFMNLKVLTDILDNFEGDRDKLDQRLIESFHQFHYDLRMLIINYFMNANSAKPAKLFKEYLEEVMDKEVWIQLLKYFGIIQYPDVLPLLEDGLDSTYWEVRAIAAKALYNYAAYFTLQRLIRSMSDQNWYVRTNTAKSVLEHLIRHHQMTDEEVAVFISTLDDKYAIGALNYAMDQYQESITIKNED